MRTETQTFEIYTFEELPTEVQKKVIENNRDINTYDDTWHDFLIEDFKEDNNIFNKTKVYYSGFWSQGDGAVFLYDKINRDFFDEFIKEKCNFLDEKRKQLIINNVTIEAKNVHKSMYYHEKSTEHYLNLDFCRTLNYSVHTNIIELLEHVENIFQAYLIETFENICTDFYKNLEKNYYIFQSDDMIKETLISNEKEFLIDGTEY